MSAKQFKVSRRLILSLPETRRLGDSRGFAEIDSVQLGVSYPIGLTHVIPARDEIGDGVLRPMRFL